MGNFSRRLPFAVNAMLILSNDVCLTEKLQKIFKNMSMLIIAYKRQKKKHLCLPNLVLVFSS